MNKKEFSLAVYKTDEYTSFRTLNGNRDLNKTQVNRLAKIVATNPEFTRLDPIKVNDEYEVIDGQHRLQAYKKHYEESGTAHPVYYVIIEGAGLADARRFNAGSKPWNPNDYAQAYAKSGHADYRKYLEFKKFYDLNHDILVRYLALGNDYSLPAFRDGKFSVADEKKSHKLLEQLEEVGSFLPETTGSNDHKYKLWKFRGFALPYLSIAMHPRYNHKRMVEQMKEHGHLLRSVPLKQVELTSAFRQIYNKGRDEKVDISSTN